MEQDWATITKNKTGYWEMEQDMWTIHGLLEHEQGRVTSETDVK